MKSSHEPSTVESKETGYLHSMETFGTVDGPGIRLVLIIQGCPMRCLYCHNPDTWTPRKGQPATVDEILELYEKNKIYYQNGGITATGGEPLLQLSFLTELFEKAKEKGIHTCLDTSGITFSRKQLDKFNELIKYTDLVMLDIKHIDKQEHIKLTGMASDNVTNFAMYLSENNIPVWIRHVLVPGITLNDEHLYNLGRFIGNIKTLKAVDVLPYHDMGKTKYKALGMDYPLEGTPIPTKDDTLHAREIILSGVRDTLKETV